VTVAPENDLDQRQRSPPRDAPGAPASPPDPDPEIHADLADSSASGAKGFASPPAKLMRSVAKAVSEWQMIVPGDRVMLGLSGGKDSLAMLHVLKALQRRYPPGTFELACCTIDPGTEAFNPRPLIQYCASLGVEYHYKEERIMDMASEHMSGDSICAFCARMKRGALYSCMREHGYNKLVLAQHLDDVVESFLMSTMHNGLIRTMKAAYVVDEGDLTVIRPGIYCRERQLRDFSYAAGLPVINENCPACFEAPKERHHIKKLLAREEGVFPSLYPCLRRALTPLLDPAATDLLAAIRRAVERQSKVGRQALAQKNAAAREKKAGVPSRAGGVPDEPLQDRARVDDGGDDADETKERSRATTATVLRDCTETELLAELVARRTRGRLGKDPRLLKRAELGDGAITPPRPRTPSTDLGDAEMRADVAELNAFCTADGCARFPAEDDDE
jgi:tRNA(Ile)-lysidine synthase TilS/MesJ